MAKIDAPVVELPKGKQFVTIPDKDLFDQRFPTIRINRYEFEAGQTYELDEPIASTVKERISACERANLRILQPKKDIESQNIMTRNGSSRGGQFAS